MSDYATMVSDMLCIRSKNGRKEVSDKVRKQFDKLLYNYVEKSRRTIEVRPVSIIFQNPKTPYKRRNHRNGVFYLEKSLLPVINELPVLGEGEYYEFPSIEFILERNGTGSIYFR